MKTKVNQKPISFKIAFNILDELDKECYVSGKKRNTLINLAIGYYLEYLDCCRLLSCSGTRETRRLVFNDFKRRQFQNLIDF